jgi:hypothetical protein
LAQPATGLLSYTLGVAAGILAYLMIDRVVMANRSKFYSPMVGRTLLAAVAYTLVLLGMLVGLVVVK